MPALTVDGRAIEVVPGATVLTAAAALGIRIPTLCHLADVEPLVTCMVCLVEERATGRLLPSCATQAEEGMCIETRSDLALDARRSALALLLSEHAGECEAPCARACPLGIDIPELLDHLECDGPAAAWQVLRASVALPATAARLCGAGCEKACRRREIDHPVRVRAVHAELAAWRRQRGNVRTLPCDPSTGRHVTIVGAGPTGLAAADELLARGHTCTLYDQEDAAGQSLRRVLALGSLEEQTLTEETAAVLARGALLQRFGVCVGRDVSWFDVRRDCDAVLIATGEAPRGVEALGVATAAGLVVVTPGTYATAAAGILAAGGATRTGRNALRSMAQGREMGQVAHHMLSGRPLPAAPRRFSALIGGLSPEELHTMAANRVQRNGASSQAARHRDGFTTHGLEEAHRCIGCGCRSARSCTLRDLCAEHGVEPRRVWGARRAVVATQHHAHVRHEAGKCVLCGRCVRLAEMAGEPLGLAMTGRGFATRVRVPLARPFADSLERSAAACAAACPTGALTSCMTPKESDA